MSTLDQRCPQCAALVRGGTGWCTLCHADLRPAPEPSPAPAPEPEPVTAADVVELAEVEELVAAEPAPRTGGRHAKHAKPDVAPDAGTADGAAEVEDYTDLLVDIDDPEVMFALLRADGRDPILAKLEGPLASPGARAALIIGGGLALTAVLFLTLALVGTVLR